MQHLLETAINIVAAKKPGFSGLLHGHRGNSWNLEMFVGRIETPAGSLETAEGRLETAVGFVATVVGCFETSNIAIIAQA
jgi:hypothetical protein